MVVATTLRRHGWLAGSWLTVLGLPAATATFLILVAWMHAGKEAATRWRTPLSLLRDGPAAAEAHLAFGLLLLIHALLLHAAWLVRDRIATVTFAAVGVLLGLVAVTPSESKLHLTVAIIALCVAYSYYAFLLRRRADGWLWLHLTMPVGLAVAAWCLDPHPFEVLLVPTATGPVWVPPVYGIWQKAMLAYLLLLANLHGMYLHASRARTRESVRVD